MPNITMLRLDDGSPDQDVSGLPRVCDSITDWFFSNTTSADWWLWEPYSFVVPEVQTFLDGYMAAEQLFEDDFHWNQCFDLELAQDRIAEGGTYWKRVYFCGTTVPFSLPKIVLTLILFTISCR